MPPKRKRAGASRARTGSSGRSRSRASASASPSPKRARARSRPASPAPTFEGLPAAAKARVARFLTLPELRRLTRVDAGAAEAAAFELQRRVREYRKRVGSAADAERLARILGDVPVAEAVFLGERARVRDAKTVTDGLDYSIIYRPHEDIHWAAETMLRTKFPGARVSQILRNFHIVLFSAAALVEPELASEAPKPRPDRCSVLDLIAGVGIGNAAGTLVSMVEALGRYEFGADYERGRDKHWLVYAEVVLNYRGSRVLQWLEAVRARGLLNARLAVRHSDVLEAIRDHGRFAAIRFAAPDVVPQIDAFIARLAMEARGPDHAMRLALRLGLDPAAIAQIARAGARPDHVSARRRETHAHAALRGMNNRRRSISPDPTARAFLREAERFAANKKNHKGRTLLHVAPVASRRRLANQGVDLTALNDRGRMFFERDSPLPPSPMSSPSPSRSRSRSRS